MRACSVAVLTFLVLASSAAWADPVRALERAGSRLARTRLAEKELTALVGNKLVLSVRRGTIIATQGLSQRGFFLSNGALSAADRDELSRLIAKRAPGTSARQLLHQLGREIRKERAVEKRLDPVIDGLLRTTSTASEREVWRGSRGSLVQKDGLLVGYRGFSSEAFFTGRGAKGLTIAPEERSRLRDFLRRTE
jgi:hypothetical protein